jgi:hypothetical protein
VLEKKKMKVQITRIEKIDRAKGILSQIHRFHDSFQIIVVVEFNIDGAFAILLSF